MSVVCEFLNSPGHCQEPNIAIVSSRVKPGVCEFCKTRGIARFARIPLVIRLGDFSEIYLYIVLNPINETICHIADQRGAENNVKFRA